MFQMLNSKNMKKFIFLSLLIIAATQIYAQSPKVDTLRFVRGGQVYQVIIYGTTGNRDSVKINGKMFYDGWKYDKDHTNVLKGCYPNSLIKYEGIRGINGTGKPTISKLVIFHPGDDILYALDTVHSGGGEPYGPVLINYIPVNSIYNMNLSTMDTIPVDMKSGIISRQNITLKADKMLCIGDTAHNGSWRFGLSGQALIFQRRESGVWVQKEGFNLP